MSESATPTTRTRAAISTGLGTSASFQSISSELSASVLNAVTSNIFGQSLPQTSSSSRTPSEPVQAVPSVSSTQTSTRTIIIDTTSYNLPSSYTLPSSYPLPTTYSLPSSYPLPSSYNLPSSYPLPTSYDLLSTVTYQLPNTFSVPSPISDQDQSTSTVPTAVTKDPLNVGSLLVGLVHNVQNTQAFSPSETSAIVVSSLPTSLAQLLSTLGLPTAVHTAPGIQITVTPASTVLNPSQLSSSVKHALASGGVPTAVASALLPVILTGFDTTVTVPTNLPSPVVAALQSAVHKEQIELQASINAFVQWLLTFLHLE